MQTKNLRVGEKILARTPSTFLPGTIVSIQDPPSRGTGGRGIGVRFDDGTYGDGWCDFTITRR